MAESRLDFSISELVSSPLTKKLRVPVSQACLSFVANVDDIRDFYALHQAAKNANNAVVLRKLHVANKAVLVLVAALWEAYCEDLADEGIRLLVEHAPTWENLPRPLLKVVAKELSKLEAEFAPWALAGEGWRTYLLDRLDLLGRQRRFLFATPKSSNVDRLFLESLGIIKVSDAWGKDVDEAQVARDQLDDFIERRNEIAHRYVPGNTVGKNHVKDFFNLVAALVARTDATVGRTIREVTGENRWANPTAV